MQSLKFSVLGSLTGYPEDVSDFRRAARAAGLDVSWDRGPGEYAYLATECGKPSGFWCHWLWRAVEVRVSGVTTAEKFLAFCEDIGAAPSGSGTLGSLGGPLGPFIVPDIDFDGFDDERTIGCLRATPFRGSLEDGGPVTEAQWDRIERGLVSRLGGRAVLRRAEAS